MFEDKFVTGTTPITYPFNCLK